MSMPARLFPARSATPELVAEIESMPAAAWAQAKESLRSRDEEESRRQQAAGNLHYAIRFNRFMGVRSDWTENE